MRGGGSTLHYSWTLPLALQMLSMLAILPPKVLTERLVMLPRRQREPLARLRYLKPSLPLTQLVRLAGRGCYPASHLALCNPGSPL